MSKTYIDEFGEEREKVKPGICLSKVKEYYELEKARGTPWGKETLETYCKEIEIIFNIIDDVSARE